MVTSDTRDTQFDSKHRQILFTIEKEENKEKETWKGPIFKKRSSNDTNLFDKNVLILSQEFLNPHVDAIPVVVSPHVELGGHDELQDDADQKLGGRARVTRVQKGLNFFSENV